jgi:putative transposase
MTNETDSTQAKWARFRFAVVGPLLTAPPEKGEQQVALQELAKKKWRHPITGKQVYFAKSTIERWFYLAIEEQDPVSALRTKKRADAGTSKLLTSALKNALQQQYKNHPSWSYQLHSDNLAATIRKHPELGPMVSYYTVRRYMQSNQLRKQRRVKHKDTQGALRAQQRLDTLEVRSYEMDHVNALWHLDFHHGSCKIVGKNGQWYKPLLLAIMDDRSRIICHAQWYLDETVETLVHGFMQALQKRNLPRAVMSDNGAAMVADEFKSGLLKLGIVHETTLPYSPYQNGKQETFWGQVEGRLLAMLEGEAELSLSLLNKATLVWIEGEYHRKLHSEINTTPLERYLQGPDISRPCPQTQVLREAFCARFARKQRRSDGTCSLAGKRFEIPSQFRHIDKLCVAATRWDLSKAYLIDPITDKVVSTIYPQDKSANAEGKRRALREVAAEQTPQPQKPTGMAPLLKELMAEFAATGLPPAYISREYPNE